MSILYQILCFYLNLCDRYRTNIQMTTAVDKWHVEKSLFRLTDVMVRKGQSKSLNFVRLQNVPKPL